MKANLFFLFFSIVSFTSSLFSQQLVINEVSQGPTGAQEYVELVVTGIATCNSIPCMDLRNFIVDDNNGNHATGSGTGIAPGCVRFKNIPFWSCIPIGTMILIYNDADQNPLIPAQDLSMSDGNCKLVIPVSDCTLLERHTSQPSTSSAFYQNAGYINCGSWTPVSMANGDDSFQTIDPSGTMIHSVSWGNNSLLPIIYFAGSAAGKVALMNNSADNNPFNQANWTFVNVLGSESPGTANNPANNAWIIAMNNSCLPLLPFSTSVSSGNSGCTCNGSATVAASGAIVPYTYTWFPSGGNLSLASGLCSGIYTVIATSLNGCTQTKTVSIASVSTISLLVNSVSVTCNGMFNGSASVSANGGVAPYSYTWSPAAGNSSVATGLSAGIYSITVNDNNNCSATVTTAILQPAFALNAVVNTTAVSCFGGNNGSANIIVSGGTPGYSYTWAPTGIINSFAANLSAGNYSVFITDANNCMLYASAFINQPTVGLSAVTITTNNPCFGASNGAIQANVTGGTPGYTFSWSPAIGNNSILAGVPAGNYSVTIQDLNNCITTATAAITQPASALSSVINSTNVPCFGASNGIFVANVYGGTPGYTYTLSPSGINSYSANTLTAGNYTLFVKDANNCTLTSSLNITEPQPILVAVNSLTLCNNQTGILTATVSGGVGPFVYNWNGSPTSSNSITVSQATTTFYNLSVSDVKGCISNNQTASVSVGGILNLNITNSFSTCSGGAVLLSANATGGTGNYNYVWQPGLMNGALQSIPNVTTSRVYTLTVSDGCSVMVSKTVSVSVYPLPPSEITSSMPGGCSPVCISFSDTPLLSSGLVQSYQWNFGDNTSGNLAIPEHCYITPGDYSVSINYQTVNGCVVTQTLGNYIKVYPTPTAAFISDKNEIDLYNPTVHLTNQSLNATAYSWFFSNEGNSHDVHPTFAFLKEEDQLISLIATNEYGCADTAMKEIKYKFDFTFFAPNSFTPNNDNLNEVFLPVGTGWNTNKFVLEIYDRWGAKIFATNKFDEGWDGRFHGFKVQTDEFIWKVIVFDRVLKRHEFIGRILVEAN